MDVSFKDVKAAFHHFLINYNQGRPFILAGFSQGGKSVVELMKHLSEEERKRMIAAYVLGYKVTLWRKHRGLNRQQTLLTQESPFVTIPFRMSNT